jgi:hypothetical protein
MYNTWLEREKCPSTTKLLFGSFPDIEMICLHTEKHFVIEVNSRKFSNQVAMLEKKYSLKQI